MTHGSPLKNVRVLAGHRRQHGLSLIELLVAMGLGLVMVWGIGTVYLGSRQTYRMQEANARVQETGRFAMEVIGRSLRQAGADANITAGAFQCDDGSGLCTAVNGTDDSVNGTTSDTLTVEFYAGLEEQDAGNWGSRDCTGRFVAVNFLIANTFSLNGTDLRCKSEVVSGHNSNVEQPLVSEVEDFQIIYGVDADGNQSADIYTATPDAGQWPKVVAARVCVMVRSVEEGLAASGQTPLDCPHALDTELISTVALPAINDTRLHRAFVATYNLRNRITNTP